MTVLRCTKKLLTELRVKPDPADLQRLLHETPFKAINHDQPVRDE